MTGGELLLAIGTAIALVAIMWVVVRVGMTLWERSHGPR